MEFCQSEKMGTLGVRAVKKLSNFKSKVCFGWFWAKIKLIIPKSRVHRKDQYKTVVTILYPKKKSNHFMSLTEVPIICKADYHQDRNDSPGHKDALQPVILN